MIPVPYTNPVAAVVFYGLFVAFVVIEVRIERRSRATATESGQDRRSKRVALICIAVGLGAAFVLAPSVHLADVVDGRLTAFGVGAALMAAGITLRQWSISTLGRFFTTDVRVAPDQTVIDSGPYRLVRHPSYTASVITFAGIGLALGNWLSLACAVLIPLAGYVARIRYEEQVLNTALGGPYQRYAATHKRLFPGVW